MDRRLIFMVLASVPWGVAGLLTSAQQQKVTFEGKILPIFRAHCLSCHGSAQRSGGLDLSSAGGLRQSKTVVAGKPSESVLIQRIKGEGNRPRMPKGFGPLSPEDVSAIENWISEGADYSGGSATHWAYIAPLRPNQPTVEGKYWVRNPIDTFILAKLEAQGLSPSKEASRETLIRRVSLDLTGLPPSPLEIDQFLRDRRKDAYERLVDRLLSSPHFGERQAQKWLDLARYADTNGYEKDSTRSAWKYRDWVIDAFNKNMPYSEFTVEQLAGDLIPSPSVSQLIATGFHRNTMLNLEGGVDPEEAMYETINDRVATTATVWLGTSLACARCHDHKYDPLTQEDYFRFYAFFNNNQYEPKGRSDISEMKYFEPTIMAPSVAQSRRLKELKERIAEISRRTKDRSKEVLKEQKEWERNLEVASLPQYMNSELRATNGVELAREGDGIVAARGNNPANSQYEFTSVLTHEEVGGILVEALPDKSFVQGGPGRSSSGNFILSKAEIQLDGKDVKVARAETDYAQPGYSAEATLDENTESGWAVADKFGIAHAIAFRFRPALRGHSVKLTLQFASRQWPQHALGRLRVSTLRPNEVSRALLPVKVREALEVPRTAESQELLNRYFLTIAPCLAADRASLKRLSEEQAALEASIPVAQVLQERESRGPLTAWLRTRGEFLSKSREVLAGTPKAFPPLEPGGRADRLALARWLVDGRNPLTSRVQVNRLWEQCFGRGIVETSENFGTQGSPPSHQELLDWLACEFQSRNWDIKAILRLIVTSATYRQDSATTLSQLERDPQNILLARGPRFRLDAETIRDVALSVSGLLDKTIGGPSVYPLQPEGIWNSPYSGERWMTSTGGARHRRGLYTFWKRTAPYPSFETLDATSREQCTVRRTRTNTPLQALALLNDEAFFEAARALAQRVLVESGKEKRMDLAFRLCTARHPSPAEAARLSALLEQLMQRYRADPSSSSKVADTPELAAWTMLSNTLLNLDETITKG